VLYDPMPVRMAELVDGMMEGWMDGSFSWNETALSTRLLAQKLDHPKLCNTNFSGNPKIKRMFLTGMPVIRLLVIITVTWLVTGVQWRSRWLPLPREEKEYSCRLCPTNEAIYGHDNRQAVSTLVRIPSISVPEAGIR
jgi:hypothetical protein